MFWRMFKRKINELTGLFNGHFIEIKAWYALEFDAVSCVSFIGDLDTSKAFAFINENMRSEILSTYQHSYFDPNEQRMFFNSTIFVLKNKRMIELGNNYCQVLHTRQQYGWANDLVKSLSQFRMINNEPVIGFARHTAAN